MEGREFSSNTVGIPCTERHRRAEGFSSNEVRTRSANFAGGRTLNGTEHSNQGPSRTLNGTERSVRDVRGSNLGSELNFSITITTAPVLTHWIPDTPIMVETDASDYALAAVLSIRTPDGDYHPVAFHSRTFKDAETNHDVHDKELTAIYDTFKWW